MIGPQGHGLLTLFPLKNRVLYIGRGYSENIRKRKFKTCFVFLFLAKCG